MILPINAQVPRLVVSFCHIVGKNVIGLFKPVIRIRLKNIFRRVQEVGDHFWALFGCFDARVWQLAVGDHNCKPKHSGHNSLEVQNFNRDLIRCLSGEDRPELVQQRPLAGIRERLSFGQQAESDRELSELVKVELGV